MVNIQKVFLGIAGCGCMGAANADSYHWHLATSLMQTVFKAHIQQEHTFNNTTGNPDYNFNPNNSKRHRDTGLSQGFECGFGRRSSLWVAEASLGIAIFYGHKLNSQNIFEHVQFSGEPGTEISHNLKSIPRHYWFLEGRLGRTISQKCSAGVILGVSYANFKKKWNLSYNDPGHKGSSENCTYNRPGLIAGVFLERQLNDKLSIAADAKFHFYKNIKINYTTNDGEYTHSVKISPRIMQFGLRLKYTF